MFVFSRTGLSVLHCRNGPSLFCILEVGYLCFVLLKWISLFCFYCRHGLFQFCIPGTGYFSFGL